MGDTLRGRDFRLLVASWGLSSMGDELALIALTLKVADLTHSGLDVAALLLAGLLPLVIFAPAAGVIVDNFETTRTLAIATALQAVFAFALAFASGMPVILPLAFLLGTGTVVANPALYTLVPAVVGEEKATAANAYLETARYAGMIVGPVLAGTITARIGSRAALLVDAATFLVIALSAMALVTRRRPEGSAAEGEAGEARAGIGIIRRDAVLVLVFTIFGAVILFAAMDNVAEVFFARDTLNADGWGYGLLASMWILGMAGGAILIARKLSTDQLAPAVLISAIVGGVAIAAAAGIGLLWPAMALFIVGGVANGVESVAMRSVIVHRVADRFRGRVFAAYGGLANSLVLVATALAGWLVTGFGRNGGAAVLVIGGVGSAIAGVAGLTWYWLLPAEVRRRAGKPGLPGLPIQVPESEVVVRLPESEPARGTSLDP